MGYCAILSWFSYTTNKPIFYSTFSFLGVVQCKQFRKELNDNIQNNIASPLIINGSLPSVLVSSPLTRTLQTSEYIFGDNLPNKVICDLFCERLYLSSDVGRDKEV